MGRSLVAVCAAVAALVVVSGAASASGSARQRPGTVAATRHVTAVTPTVPQGFVGMVVDEPVWPDPFVKLAPQLDVMVASGVESIRVVFDWADAQPYASWKDVPADQQSEFTNVGGVPTNFTQLDQLVGMAAARGLTVLPVILDAPSWDGQSYPGGTVTIPATPGPYAAFAKALVKRYGPHGTFWTDDPYGAKLPIEMWQIWNEPNIPAFWPPQPYYSRYVALLRAAHAAIKSADPKAEVVLAGLPNFSWFELARIYKFPGARNLFDVVAIHPYTKSPRGVITILGYVRQVMDQAGDAGKPIIADEVSWPSSVGHTFHNVGYDFATNQAGQARNISKVIPLLVKNRVRLGLSAFYYYDWAGLERHNQLAFDFAGLFRFIDGSFVAKPAYKAFEQGVLSIEQCRSKGPLATDCNS